jgi:hypothetical protein
VIAQLARRLTIRRMSFGALDQIIARRIISSKASRSSVQVDELVRRGKCVAFEMPNAADS